MNQSSDGRPAMLSGENNVSIQRCRPTVARQFVRGDLLSSMRPDYPLLSELSKGCDLAGLFMKIT
jgi:hypothetical protein